MAARRIPNWYAPPAPPAAGRTLQSVTVQSALLQSVTLQSALLQSVTVGAGMFSALPTVLPASAGVIWNNGGVVSVS